MGVKALNEWGPWDVLYLDHDLGGVKSEKDERGRELNGSRLVDWLEEKVLNEGRVDLLPKKIILVTANSIGRRYMATVLDKLMFRGGTNEWLLGLDFPEA